MKTCRAYRFEIIFENTHTIQFVPLYGIILNIILVNLDKNLTKYIHWKVVVHSTAQNYELVRTLKTQHMMWNLYFFLSQSHTLLRCVCNIYDSFDIFNFITSHTAYVPKCLFLLHAKNSSYSLQSVFGLLFNKKSQMDNK